MTNTDWARSVTNVVAAGIKRVRGGRTVQWVSDRTTELGYTVSRSRISDIEAGKRGGPVGVAELIVIAEALDVPPLELLFSGTLVTGQMEYLPGRTMTGWEALMRFTGDGPPARYTPLRRGREYHLTLMRELIEHVPQRRSALEGRLKTDLQKLEEARQDLASTLPIAIEKGAEESSYQGALEAAPYEDPIERAAQLVEFDRSSLETLDLYAQSLITQLREAGFTVDLDAVGEEES